MDSFNDIATEIYHNIAEKTQLTLEEFSEIFYEVMSNDFNILAMPIIIPDNIYFKDFESFRLHFSKNLDSIFQVRSKESQEDFVKNSWQKYILGQRYFIASQILKTDL